MNKTQFVHVSFTYQIDYCVSIEQGWRVEQRWTSIAEVCAYMNPKNFRCGKYANAWAILPTRARMRHTHTYTCRHCGGPHHINDCGNRNAPAFYINCHRFNLIEKRSEPTNHRVTNVRCLCKVIRYEGFKLYYNGKKGDSSQLIVAAEYIVLSACERRE